MDSKDLINYEALSRCMGYSPRSRSLRRDRVPAKHRDKLQELFDYMDCWIRRHR